MSQPVPVLLMIRELWYGGTEQQVTSLALSLDRERFDVHVGCLQPWSWCGEQLERAGVPITVFPVDSFRSPALIPAVRQLATYIREHNIRLVHTFDAPTNVFGVPVAAACRVPRLSSQRSDRSLTPGVLRKLVKFTDGFVNGIVVNSDFVRQLLVREDGVAGDRIHLCYNGLDTERFRPAPRQPAKPVIGIVSALREEKGHWTLLEAFAQIRGRHPGVKLVIVGCGPPLEKLQAHSRALGLGDDCVFEPSTNQVVDWLHTIDIFVLPSLSEALSNALMEAMACGCCVIATRIGGNPELVSHENTGLLFEAGDAAGLAAQLDRVLADKSLRERLAAGGSRFIRENFSTQTSAARLAEIYSAVLTR
jgi:glycosyltransferase involved in cell wall biosynthesis